MDKVSLMLVESAAKEMLVKALTDYVRENGEEMCEYFYNEYGMYEEDDGEKIVSVLNTAQYGCFFPFLYEVNEERLVGFDNNDKYEMIDLLDHSFGFSTYWAFYIVRDKDGNEGLKYYRFYNSGVCYNDDSEPDHDYVDGMSLAELHYIFEAIQKNE